MKILVNNQERQTEATTLAALVAELQLPARGVAVAVNQQMVQRDAWEATPLHEQDQVLLIKAACGG